jgi:hypothetical protein
MIYNLRDSFSIPQAQVVFLRGDKAEGYPLTPTIITTTLIDGTTGQNYSVMIEVVGGTSPYTWELV